MDERERLPIPYWTCENTRNEYFGFTCRADCDWFVPTEDSLYNCEYRNCLPESIPDCDNPFAHMATLRRMIDIARAQLEKLEAKHGKSEDE